MLTQQALLSNYAQSVSNGAFISTDTIVLLIAIKEENFKKALKHFNNQETLINSVAQTIVKLQQLQMAMTLKDAIGIHTPAFKRDKTLESTLSTFLGDDISLKNVRQLLTMVESRFLSFSTKLI